MKPRHQARETALQILYQYDLAHHSSGQPLPSGTQLIESLKQYFTHFNTPESIREFIGQLVAGTLSNIQVLDEALKKHTANWKVSRMSSVDRCLLRMATYEMIHMKQLAPSIVIDEAIELGKQFGTSETPSFINGVLDSIRQDANL